VRARSPAPSSKSAPRRITVHAAILGLPLVNLAALTPCLRYTSAVFAPASCSRSTAMICSSVNSIASSSVPFVGPDSSFTWRCFRGQVARSVPYHAFARKSSRGQYGSMARAIAVKVTIEVQPPLPDAVVAAGKPRIGATRRFTLLHCGRARPQSV
jgi:hypothetical protein